MTTAGTAIFHARTALGMSLQELARRSDTDAGYLSRVERGLRTPTDRWVKAVTTVLFEAMGSEDVA